MEGMLGDMISGILGLQDDLLAIMEFIKIVPFSDFVDASTRPIATTIRGFSNTLQSMGITLLIFFFFYEFLKKTVMFEFVNWENVVKILLRFLIAKVLVQNCYVVLEALAIVMNGIIGLLGTPEAMKEILGEATKDSVIEEFGTLGLFDSIFFFLKYGLAWLVMMIVRAAILLIVYGRFIEIAIYTAIAPIPLATIAGESTSGVAKRFIQGYIGVLLQGLIIIVMSAIYVGVVDGFVAEPDNFVGFFGGDIVQYILLSMVLLFTLAKSGNWAKQIMGS